MIPQTGRSLSGLRPFFLSTEGKEHANGETFGNNFNLCSHYCKRSIKRGLTKKKFKEKQKCENERRFNMAANVENMFYVRTAPWHGLGTKVQEAPNSESALSLAGLDWKVVQEEIYTPQQEIVEGYKANIRDSDRKVLGVVTDRYKVIQNEEAFAFTDELLGEGVRYETAGSLQGGKRVWMLAHMPHEYIISGE